MVPNWRHVLAFLDTLLSFLLFFSFFFFKLVLSIYICIIVSFFSWLLVESGLSLTKRRDRYCDRNQPLVIAYVIIVCEIISTPFNYYTKTAKPQSNLCLALALASAWPTFIRELLVWPSTTCHNYYGSTSLSLLLICFTLSFLTFSQLWLWLEILGFSHLFYFLFF